MIGILFNKQSERSRCFMSYMKRIAKASKAPVTEALNTLDTIQAEAQYEVSPKPLLIIEEMLRNARERVKNRAMVIAEQTADYQRAIQLVRTVEARTKQTEPTARHTGVFLTWQKNLYKGHLSA